MNNTFKDTFKNEYLEAIGHGRVSVGLYIAQNELGCNAKTLGKRL
jgi:hypothetical protein